ncbi:MAG: hypothetical protein ACI9MC_001019 [Kiritimatiellia bacterium]
MKEEESRFMLTDPPETPASEQSATLVPEQLCDDRRAMADAESLDLDSMFETVAADTIDKSATWLDAFRELPTTTRVAIAGAGLLLPGVVLLGLMGVRTDLSMFEVAQVSGLALLVSAGAFVAVILSLRPTWRSPLNGLGWAAAILTGLIPFVLSVIPGLWPGVAHVPHPIAYVMCGMGGLLVAAPAAGAVLLLQRSDRTSPWRVMLGAGGAGLAAFVVSQLHCTLVDPGHMLLSHAGPGLLVGLAVLAFQRLMWRRAG